ncbi:hypothetical protein AB0I10_39365 [Streptomyces sp. NPDC050636]|uniref:hypothetical protein n=1 Tax=Streptomyces sp. NPDC050636 TaxID=3154510 RepID=UPI00342348CD
MSATTPTTPAAQQPSGQDRAVWPLLIFVLGVVGVMLAAGLLFVSARYPALATPLQVALGGVTVYAALVTIAVNLARR